MRRLAVCALAVLLLGPAGCQKLNFEKEADLGGNAPSTLEYAFDAPSGEQTIIVKATADEPISVWVVPDDDKDTALLTVNGRQKPAKNLGGQEDKKEIDFEATIPAKKGFAVLVGQGKSMRKETTVKLSVKSK